MMRWKNLLILCTIISLVSQPLVAQSAGDAETYTVDPALVALGTLSAANVYYSYLAIGTAADSYVSGVYDGRLASIIVQEVATMNTGALAKLRVLADSATLAIDDKNAIRDLITTYTLLDLQAKALLKFISDKNDEGDDYQTYRTKVWAQIQVLFGK